MIKEIVQFVDSLPPETFSRNLQLKEGLYMFLDIQEENGKAVLKNVDSEGKLISTDQLRWNPNKDEKDALYYRFFNFWFNSIPISEKKHLNPNKKIFGLSCNPYSISFRRKNVNKKSKEKILTALDELFKSTAKYVNKEFEKKHELFYSFLKGNLFDFIQNNCAIDKTKDNFEYHLYFKDIPFSEYEDCYLKYQKDKVFNKNDFNYPRIKRSNIPNDDDLGIVDAFSGFQEKKRFLIHRTSLNSYNLRISNSDALKVWHFVFMASNKQLPNPCPIFVDKEEVDLNKGVVKFHQDGEIMSYSGLIKKLITEYNKEELQNFYLIFFQGTKGSRIADIDFVPLFKYNIGQELKLKEVFSLGGKQAGHSLKTIFDLQNNVFNKVFNNQLVTKTNNGIRLKYFDEIEPNPKYHFTYAICNSMLQYRKAIYDYVYKAKYESITCRMFDEMMKTSILEDIRIDEDFRRGYSIKEKLNIWFSLYNYFSQNKNRENMANKTVELQEVMRSVINNETAHIESDDQFAFAAGQIIWKLLIQSKSANRSHALLEPFLQKTNVEQFKLAIAKTFDMYKHEFTLYPKKYGFDKLMSEVMGFEPTEQNMKNLLIYILAGYFSESMI